VAAVLLDAAEALKQAASKSITTTIDARRALLSKASLLQNIYRM
jgi:hypothetical protein